MRGQCGEGLQEGGARKWSLTSSLSQSGITCVGMWVGVEDRAAGVYDVEFLCAHHRVTV
jgi:hypothetical protein